MSFNMTKNEELSKWTPRDTSVMLWLALIAFVFRFHTFFPLAIDFDETTYAVIADHWIRGAQLYIDVIDIKQPGIYAIFAAIQLLFGKSVLAIRLIAALTIAVSAFLIYKTKLKLGFESTSSFGSAVLYVLMFNFYFGFSANTEIFFLACSVAGLFVFAHSRHAGHYAFSGLIFGLGFIVKQHALFDFAAVGLFFFLDSIRTGFRQKLLGMTVMLLSFFIPFAFVHVAFWATDNFEAYRFITYTAPGNYQSERDWLLLIKFLVDGWVVYAPFSILVIVALTLVKWDSVGHKEGKQLFILLLSFSMIGVLATGQVHPHYYLQMSIGMSLLAGEVFALKGLWLFVRRKYVPVLVLVLFVAYAFGIGRFYYHRYFIKPNRAELFVDFFEDRMRPDDTMYTGDAPQFLYWYFDKLSPTPYIHSSLMLKDSHIQTLEIDVQEQLNNIFERRPTYIILSEKYKHQDFKASVEAIYRPVGTVDRYTVYQLP